MKIIINEYNENFERIIILKNVFKILYDKRGEEILEINYETTENFYYKIDDSVNKFIIKLKYLDKIIKIANLKQLYNFIKKIILEETDNEEVLEIEMIERNKNNE